MPISSTEHLDDERRLLILDTGERVVLEFLGDEIEVWHEDEKIGWFAFRGIEYPAGMDGTETIYRVINMFLEGSGGRFTGQGIGTEAIRFFMECTGSRIEFGEDIGTTSSDGSHLTGNGRNFAEKIKGMMRRGEI